MKSDKNKKLLLIMPPFWDPICPPQGIVSLKSYLDARGYEVHIVDFNVDGHIFGLQQKYFQLGTTYFPHWKFLNIPRNGPRYFARHQLVNFMGSREKTKYNELIGLILNFDGQSICNEQIIEALDAVIERISNVVASKTRQLMTQIQPDVVGCTMLESTFPSALAILKQIKMISPKTTTILGGPGIVTGNTVDDGNLQRISEKCEWIDVIIYGEGERIIENYLQGSFRDKKIITIQDIKDNACMQSSDHNLLNVNDIPVSNYDGLPAIKYLWLSVSTSRGCPFKCAFCYEKDYWVRFRKKKIEKVIDEMKALSARYGKSKLFYLCDSLANHIASPLSKAVLSRNENIRWDCYMRITPECLNDEKVKLWARGGMERVRIGLESASQRVLELMNKDISTDQAKQGLTNFANSGINTSTLWIAGFPGERDEDFQESIKFLEENHRLMYQADIWEFISSPREISDSDEADTRFATKPAYPDEFDDMLIIKYYDQKHVSLPPERFERIRKFEERRIKLGIPNPYSLRELIDAQKRWANLRHTSK